MENTKAKKRKTTLVRQMQLYARRHTRSLVKLAGKSAVFVDQCACFIVNRDTASIGEVMIYARAPIMFGVYVVLIFVFCGGLWASLAPLDSAAHASGLVKFEANKQRIQHHKGGKVEEFCVLQGDYVSSGQVLLELACTDDKVNYSLCLERYLDCIALENRLVAQRDGLDEINFDRILLKNAKNPLVSKFIDVQTKIFKEMEGIMNNHLMLLDQEFSKCSKKLDSAKSTKISYLQNIKVTKERLNVNEELEKEGFVAKMTAATAEAEHEKAKADLASINSEIMVLEKELICSKLRKQDVRNRRFEEVLKELKEVKVRLTEAKERYDVAREYLEERFVKAPISGIVNFVTQDSVINPGGFVAEVTPTDGEMIVEAKINPQHIDAVRVGQVSKIRFVAFKTRTSPVFHGEVVSISPNIVVENVGMQQQYAYVAKIKMDQKELDAFLIPRGMKIVPGMFADIQIVTGTRTMLRYLLDPILDQAFSAMVER
ncbi:HlyD family type I secretion periplasmic adaptor subunit [Candidatus Sneabacter namystus]|uniref:Membrane fusion protein (MFP) family protein n=1 Tax=Candidatus Sneabacter namystus TaxID=2601646 RepID=A0A5C0UIV4_9RICK|nr:HlyD family type I secretion periplasmic adaptor subunit [Candidatus Sneabacter namystus]QEK39372.1 HlyD family type I secretion periplasmic adaptor subunit [Candidatus Sneabacter namystus]